MVTPAGLKPATVRTGIWCSIQLSYGAKQLQCCIMPLSIYGRKTKAYHSKKGFGKDTTAHLRHTFNTIDKYHRYFSDRETEFVSSIFHLYLESITFETYTVKIY